MGSVIRTLAFLFLSKAEYICQIKIHLINSLHLLFRYAFRVFFSDDLLFFMRGVELLSGIFLTKP